MRAAALCLAGAFLLCGSLRATADVADFLGKPIALVRVTVEGQEVSDSRVLSLIETPAGTPLTIIAVRETVTHLFALGRYEDVVVHAEAAGAGVALRYDLVPLHPIETVRFTGAAAAGLDTGRLRHAIRERFGKTPPPALESDIRRVVADDLRQQGYRHPVVNSRVVLQHGPDRATLLLDVVPGPRVTIGAVSVVGTPESAASQLLSRLKLKTGAPYEPTVIDARMRKFEEQRRSDGFLGATARATFVLDADERVANGTVTVTPGSRVRVEFKGDPLSHDKQKQLVPIAQESSIDEDTLEDFRQRIEDYFHRLGYRDATAGHAQELVNDQLLVTFTIARGPQYKVSSVELAGNVALTESELRSQLHLKAGQPFTRAALDRDVSTLKEVYRRRGFGDVVIDDQATAPAPVGSSEAPVLVRLTITENPQAIVTSVHVRADAAVPEADILPKLELQPGRPFFATKMLIDRDAIEVEYANRGYQNALVTGTPGLSADGRAADVSFTVNAGPRLMVDHVLIVGNVRTRTETIERELRFTPGEPLGLNAVLESQRRLVQLALFRRVRITQVDVGDEAKRDVLVTVEESPATTIGYGGGFEVGERTHRTLEGTSATNQQLEFAPRAFFEVGRRNLFDKNRSINLFTRISLRPKEPSLLESAAGQSTSGYGFSEYRVLGTYREPRVLGTVADGFLTATIEQQSRSTFDFKRRGFSAEAQRRLSPEVIVSGNYQIQRTQLFNERIDPGDRLDIDRLFPQVLLSSVSGSIAESTKDDQLDPNSGRYLSANGQVAPRRFGSEIGFLKLYFTAQVFRPLPSVRGTVVAASARLGMAYGFPRTVIVPGDSVQPVVDQEPQPDTTVVNDLPASERFFAGGDTTVRGFAVDQLGAPETLDKNGFALGGNAVVIFNLELRIPLRGSVGMVGFLDTGNVFARTTHIDLGELRSAAGFGIRYKSPVGPIRVDLGFKLQRHTIGDTRESATALHLSLGQAF